MAEAIKPTRIVHHKKLGPVEMYAIDAHHAVSAHPEEWADQPHSAAPAQPADPAPKHESSPKK